MNKKKIGLAVLALALCIGIVSAALLEYYGRIVATVNVKQVIYVDGKPWYDPFEETFDAMGGVTKYTYHYIKSKASVPITMQFVYTITNSSGYEDFEGITVSYECDIKRVTITENPTVNDVNDWSFEAEGEGVIPTLHFYLDNDDDGIADVRVEAEGAYYASKTLTETFQTFNRTQYEFGSLGIVAWYMAYNLNPIDDWSMRGYPNWEAIQIGSKDYPALGDATLLWVNIIPKAGDTVETGAEFSITIRDTTTSESIVPVETNPLTLEPREFLNFYIVYKFDTAIVPDTYTITTEVQPA